MRITILLFLITFSISAQIKGVVVDENNKPIPFVNIWVENENIGTTSEEDGTFSLNVNKEKSIVFSAIGYEKKIIKADNVNCVSLLAKFFELNEVVIEKRKGTKETCIGEFSGIDLNAGVANVGQENVHVWAKLIRFNEKIKEHPFIKSIEFVTESKINNVLLRIRIININKDEIPIGDAVYEDILVSINKGQKNNIVDLTKYNIKIPKEGIFIGFEYLKLEQNKLVENEKITRYEPAIKAFLGGETLAVLNRDGTLRSGIPGDYGNVEIALKIKLTN
jgi:hypothetical protein